MVFFLSSFICFIGEILFSIILFWINPKRLINKVFALLSISLSFWVLGDFFYLTFLKDTSLLFWVRVANVSAAFVPVFFTHFVVLFSQTRFFKIEIKYFYGISSLLAFFAAFSSNYINSVILKNDTLFINTGIIYYLFLLYIAICLCLSIYILISEYKKAQGFLKIQIQYFFGAIFVTILALVIYFPSITGIKIPRIDNLFQLLFLSLIAYSITKHELMDIRVVISRSFAYGIVGILMILSMLTLNLLSIPAGLMLVINILLVIFWSIAAHRLRAFIQTPLEEKWITGWYNSDKLLNSIVEKLTPVLEKDKVFSIIAEELKDKIKIKYTYTLVYDKEGSQRYLLISEEGGLFGDGFSSKDPFITGLAEITSYDKLSPTAQSSIDDLPLLKKAFFLPFHSTEGLEGAVVLGPKVSEDGYTKKDLTLFNTVKIQALMVLDRIRPYEKIKKEFEANQKKLYDTERVLARSEKIASMANLIQEYNHEIKTPLTIIRGETESLTSKPRDMAYLKWFQDLVIKHIDRAIDIVKTTLRLSSTEKQPEEELNLNDIINEALELFPPSGVHLEKHLSEIPLMKGVADDLRRVFLNLIKNAVEAMPEGGDLKITTYLGREEDDFIICAEISDTGVGIDPLNKERIFEPFFSTHVTKGRGLGLSIVFRIVREHLGNIEVFSQPNQGTTMKLKFMAKDSA